MFRRLDHINDRLYVRSGYGHDKSQAILQYRNLPDPPTIFFFGDGVSGEPFALSSFYPGRRATISVPTLRIS